MTTATALTVQMSSSVVTISFIIHIFSLFAAVVVLGRIVLAASADANKYIVRICK